MYMIGQTIGLNIDVIHRCHTPCTCLILKHTHSITDVHEAVATAKSQHAFLSMLQFSMAPGFHHLPCPNINSDVAIQRSLRSPNATT
jgi:hypothetical protein